MSERELAEAARRAAQTMLAEAAPTPARHIDLVTVGPLSRAVSDIARLQGVSNKEALEYLAWHGLHSLSGPSKTSTTGSKRKDSIAWLRN